MIETSTWGHDAILVTAPDVHELARGMSREIAHGCTERPQGSFQCAQGGGLWFSWMSTPRSGYVPCDGACGNPDHR
jgi:hypothetical protein